MGGHSKTLPPKPVGLTITVRARSGKSWDATITEGVEHGLGCILVHYFRRNE